MIKKNRENKNDTNKRSEKLLEQSSSVQLLNYTVSKRLINIPNLGNNGLISNLALRR